MPSKDDDRSLLAFLCECTNFVNVLSWGQLDASYHINRIWIYISVNL